MEGRIPKAGSPWIYCMLFSRITLFPVIQGAISIIFALSGRRDSWEASIAWWPIVAIIVNFICLFAMSFLLRREGKSLKQFYTFSRRGWLRDMMEAIAGLFAAAVLTVIPNTAGAALLFGNSAAAVSMMFRPLPEWSLWVTVLLFPVTVALTELPMYFGFIMPRLKDLTNRSWAAVLLTGLLFGAQHAALPLIFNWRFIVWRLVMLLLFTMFIAALLNWKPKLLPYYVVGHFFINLQFALLLFSQKMDN